MINLIIIISSLVVILLIIALFIHERSYKKNKTPFHKRMRDKNKNVK
jgi:high-affinity Fe2+/Pb2+ permease